MDLARDKHVLFWLTSLAALIIIMIIVGGLTRLTESGLSMVNWDPLMGTIPPLSNYAWNDLFDQYKIYPEFKIKNSEMNLSNIRIRNTNINIHKEGLKKPKQNTKKLKKLTIK